MKIFNAKFGRVRNKEKSKMESETTTSPQAMLHTSTQIMNQESANGLNDLKRKADFSDAVKTEGSSASAAFDMTDYDLKAHSLLCAELLNGEGVDRLPEETDAELVSRLWASWNECKFQRQLKFVKIKDLTLISKMIALTYSGPTCS